MELIPRNASISVGTSVVEVSPETSTRQRKLIVLSNVSTGGQIIYLAAGQDAVLSAGIPLRVGSSYAESIDSAFKPTNLRWTAIADLAGATLALSEQVE